MDILNKKLINSKIMNALDKDTLYNSSLVIYELEKEVYYVYKNKYSGKKGLIGHTEYLNLINSLKVGDGFAMLLLF